MQCASELGFRVGDPLPTYANNSPKCYARHPLVFSRQAISSRDDLSTTVARFATRAVEAIAADVRAWWAPNAVERGQQDVIAGALRKCFDSAVAAALQEQCPVPGTNVQDYLSRLLAAPDGREALTSTRFRGMRTSESFVQLEATSFALGIRDLEQLIASVKAIYRRLQPRWLRVYSGAGQADELLDELYWLPDLHVVAGSLDELRQRPHPPGYEQLALRPWAGSYPRYAAEYERFAAAHPRLAGEVSAHPVEVMNALARDGWLFDAYEIGSDSWLGTVGARAEPLFGAPAIAMYEELLVAGVRGRGLGPALQRHLIDRLPDHNVLWGTIHGYNQPSLRTAIACGRTEVGHYRLYEL